MKRKTTLTLFGLGGILGLCVVCLAPVVLIMAIVFLPLRYNPGLVQGMKILENDPAVIKEFGSPVQQSIIIMGQLHTSLYGSGWGNLWTPIWGPKNSGDANISLKKSVDGPWVVESMSIDVNHRPVLDWSANRSSSGFKLVRTAPPASTAASPMPPPTEVPLPTPIP